MNELLVALDDDFEPGEDAARTIIEPFLDWDLPPETIRCEQIDGRWYAIAYGGRKHPA